MKELISRISAPTPSFWKKVQKIGLIFAGIAGVITAAPIGLPVAVTSLAGYLTVASGSIAAISQLTVEPSKTEDAK